MLFHFLDGTFGPLDPKEIRQINPISPSLVPVATDVRGQSLESEVVTDTDVYLVWGNAGYLTQLIANS